MPLGKSFALPDAPDTKVHKPAFLDRIGDQFRDRLALVAAGGLGGAIAGSKLPTKFGIGLGALAGAATVALGGALVDRVTKRGHESATPARANGADQAENKVVADETLKVMAYNVHGGMGDKGEFIASKKDLDRLADVIAKENPDVVLLQELDRFATRSGYNDTLQELAERLDADGAVMTETATRLTGRQEGTGVLTFNGVTIEDARGLRIDDNVGGTGLKRRFGAVADGIISAITTKIIDKEVRPFGAREYHPRVTTDAMLHTPAGNSVRVLSGHYNPSTDEVDHPRREVDSLAGVVAAWDGPTILGADFNTRTNSDHGALERDVLAQAGLADSLPDGEVEQRDGVSTTIIDRLYASKHFTTTNGGRIPESASGKEASDHQPVFAEYRLQKNEGS